MIVDLVAMRNAAPRAAAPIGARALASRELAVLAARWGGVMARVACCLIVACACVWLALVGGARIFGRRRSSCRAVQCAAARLLRGGLDMRARRCVVPWWPLGTQGT